MGCDIHLVLEQKNDAGKWVGVDTFNGHQSAYGAAEWSLPIAKSRNYERFAALAGVRGTGPEPLGLPDDASDTTLMLAHDWAGDGHSHSYLPLDEAGKIFLQTEHRKLEPTNLAVTDPAYHYFGVDASDDYRIVFWFDN